MMKPPIFSSLPSATHAKQFMHRARMFQKAAGELVDYSNGEQFLPKYALLTHAIELALKAFVLHSVPAGRPFKRDHNLRELYQSALQYGLPEDPTITEKINYLHELHFTHYLRYPDAPEPKTSVRDLSADADTTVEYLFETLRSIINLRCDGKG